jgi:hypothetical protein
MKTTDDVGRLIHNAHKAAAEKPVETSRRLLGPTLYAYGWTRLDETLVRLKKEYPGDPTIKLWLDPDLPHALLVRMIDVARWKLPLQIYKTNAALWRDINGAAKAGYDPLFPNFLLLIV